ncbi:MAG TPA: DNA-binding protein [Cytophagales bacterium]|nr:DNA-binding protein [Cytophagales bacterium]
MEEHKESGKAELYSRRVRAGKRTYFFDVKSTRSNDYYLTITESKRRYKDDGFFYEKHKIFLYKEDFNKFVEALGDTVNHVKEKLLPDVDFAEFDEKPVQADASGEDFDSELKWE